MKTCRKKKNEMMQQKRVGPNVWKSYGQILNLGSKINEDGLAMLLLAFTL